ncbi:MAG: DNA recombination protein RmuC [Sphingomonadales bacterium]|jgi:DNA recombination protein RmuC
MENIVFLIIGIVVGVIVTYFIVKSQFSGKLAATETWKQQADLVPGLQQENKDQYARIASLEADVKNLTEQNKNLQQSNEATEKLMRKIMQEVTNEGLVKQGQVLTQQQEKTLGDILNPLKEKLKEFEQKVETTRQEASTGNTQLLEQIKNLTVLNNTITEQTQNLTNALKGNTKMQGGWGEMILERVLDSSGLTKGREYETQFVTSSSSGATIKPDAVIFLPEEKNIIVDAKVSLTAYEQYTSAADGSTEKELALKAHVTSLKNHIKQLSEKDYHTALDLKSPEFTLMFIPIESGFALTIQTDKELFEFAWSKKIVLVSPSTLLASLRTVASVWKAENSNKNTLEIARQAGDMYDKFVGFAETLNKVGDSIKKADTLFEDAVNKLSTGKGNLVNRAESLRKLGIKTTKALPAAMLPEADEITGNEELPSVVEADEPEA